MKAEWMVMKAPDLRALAQQTGLSQMILHILYHRGMQTETDIRNFLNPKQMSVIDPFLLIDMEAAVERIGVALESGEHIRIVGDYDQDGVSSTAILVTCLQQLGATVDYRIPDRMTEGYGLQANHVDDAKDQGVSLIITCDNGVQSFSAAQRCREVGIDLVVTDHHRLAMENEAQRLPDAVAVVNPHRTDCVYPYKELAGAGVALKVSQALWRRYGKGDFPPILVGFAALGTVADIVALNGENRWIVTVGLEVLNRECPVGIQKLKEASSLSGKIDAYGIGYVIAPSINAAGRLADASVGVRLLLTEDAEEAARIATELRALNVERQTLTEEALDEANALLQEREVQNIMFLELPNAHESILGIVAGKLRDQLYRPVFLATQSQEEGILKGSARSIASYAMIEEMQAVDEHLIKYGGHAMAAGFSLKKADANGFYQSLLAHWKPEEGDLTPKIKIDFPIRLPYVTAELVNELRVLEPYGKSNSKPVFASRQVILAGMQVIGKNKNTLKYRFLHEKGEMIGIQFGRVEETLRYLYRKYGLSVEDAFAHRGDQLRVDIVYTPQLNEYKGSSRLQLVISDIR